MIQFYNILSFTQVILREGPCLDIRMNRLLVHLWCWSVALAFIARAYIIFLFQLKKNKGQDFKAKTKDKLAVCLFVFQPYLDESYIHVYMYFLESKQFMSFKGTNVFSPDFFLLQLYTRLHLSDYPKFWNTERWKSFD